MNDEKEGAFVIPEELPKCRKIGKEEFVRRMMSDAHRRTELEKKEAERQKIRIINDYISRNISDYHHRMHLRMRGKR